MSMVGSHVPPSSRGAKDPADVHVDEHSSGVLSDAAGVRRPSPRRVPAVAARGVLETPDYPQVPVEAHPGQVGPRRPNQDASVGISPGVGQAKGGEPAECLVVLEAGDRLPFPIWTAAPDLVPADHCPQAGPGLGGEGQTSRPASSKGVEADETGALVGTEKRRMPIFVPASTVGMTRCYVGDIANAYRRRRPGHGDFRRDCGSHG